MITLKICETHISYIFNSMKKYKFIKFGKIEQSSDVGDVLRPFLKEPWRYRVYMLVNLCDYQYEYIDVFDIHDSMASSLLVFGSNMRKETSGEKYTISRIIGVDRIRNKDVIFVVDDYET